MSKTAISHELPVIHAVRGQSVILDADLARYFDVETRALNQQVKRNAARFGSDFVMRLTAEEVDGLTSQIVMSNDGRGGSRHLPYGFTEHGVVMAATLLRSETAIKASRFIVNTFVQARRNFAAKQKGENTPLLINPKATIPLAAEMRNQLMGKINEAIGEVLNAIVNPATKSTVRGEIIEIANEGLSSLKEYLKRPGTQNEKTLAEVRKLIAEADEIEVSTSRKRTQNESQQLALLAQKLRLILEAQYYAETGSVERFLGFLKDFSRDGAAAAR